MDGRPARHDTDAHNEVLCQMLAMPIKSHYAIISVGG
jgi:hypothetical protein